MSRWTIMRGDGDCVWIVPAEMSRSTADLNGVFATRREAIETAIEQATDELVCARSRVRKLRAKLRRELPNTKDQDHV
jgi:hypothetical protein